MKLFFFDLETTGTDVTKHAIHQIAAIIETPAGRAELNYKVRPKEGVHMVSPEALEICGITIDELKSYPPMEEAYRDLITHLNAACDRYDKQDKFFMVGFNCQGFDGQFLRKFWADNNDNFFGSYFWPNTLDVYVLATRELMEQRHLMPNFKLHTVAQALGLIVDEERLHDAMYDVELTEKMYRILMEKNAAQQMAA